MSENELAIQSDVKEKALKLMFQEKKSADETAGILKSEGYIISPAELRDLKISTFVAHYVVEEAEAMADKLSDSLAKTSFKLDKLYSNLEKLYARAEREKDTFQQTVISREMRETLHMILKKLGGYKHEIASIRIQSMNVITNTDVMRAIQTNIDSLFNSSEPDLVISRDGSKQLILKKPSPEILDAYYTWKFRKGRGEVF